MNINLQPKKCSGESRYSRYGSYATVFPLTILSTFIEKQTASRDTCLLANMVHLLAIIWFHNYPPSPPTSPPGFIKKQKASYNRQALFGS